SDAPEAARLRCERSERCPLSAKAMEEKAMRRMEMTGWAAPVRVLRLLASASASAQEAGAAPTKFSIGAFIGYRGGGSGTDTSTGNNYQLASAQSYGLWADFRVSPDTAVELLWSQQNTRLEQTSPSNAQLFDVNVGYYQIRGTC